MGKTASVISLNVGKPKALIGLDSEVLSGINKTPVTAELYLSKVNLAGDEQADKKNHGGEDKAVCVYPYEHYTYWEAVIGKKLPTSAFGENITIKGLLEEEVNIGDIYQWGDAVVQISQPRIPCHKLEKYLEVKNMPQQVKDTGYTGYYMRVLKEGIVSAKSPLLFIERTSNISIASVNNTFYNNKEDVSALRGLLDTTQLAEGWRSMVEKQLEKLK